MRPLQVLPGGRLLASSDETGNVAVADLRMLGSARQSLLWQVHGFPCFLAEIVVQTCPRVQCTPHHTPVWRQAGAPSPNGSQFWCLRCQPHQAPEQGNVLACRQSLRAAA